jgi:chemotaxis regulatin CheY-phosphate phosphatase CheZ
VSTCSIEDDILNLVDEVDVDEFLKEASEAIEDAEKLSEFIREKTTIAIERFLVSHTSNGLTSNHCVTNGVYRRIMFPRCRFQ